MSLLLKPDYTFSRGLGKANLPRRSGEAMIYVAASDLIPEVNGEKGVRMAFMVFVGVALFYPIGRLLSGLGF